jgi:hypothetical protein
MASLHEHILNLIRNNKLVWDSDEDSKKAELFFDTCPNKDLLRLSSLCYDDCCVPCSCCPNTSNDIVAMIKYKGIYIASLTARILPPPSETEDFPRFLFLDVPGSKNGDGTFNVQEISPPCLDDYICYAIQFNGRNWHLFE